MSYKPMRTFDGGEGDYSVDDKGPDAIKDDIDTINKMFDPDATHDNDERGGISKANLNFDMSDPDFSETLGTPGLAYLGSSNTTIAGQLAEIADILENAVVHRAGAETVTGDKTFSGEVHVPTPSEDSHAVTKEYADDIDESAVHLSGTETVTGNKTFSGEVSVPTPTEGSHAVTKDYADNVVADAVDDWITAHPEIVTTVQDGAITKTKLSDSLSNQFIDGLYDIARFNNAASQSTFVYWRYISGEYEPRVAYCNDSVDYGVKMANENGATCAVNASRFNTDTGEYYGYFRVDGTTIHENDVVESSNSYHILCYKNNTLTSQPINTSTADMDALDYEWALTGFEAIIIDGEPTARADVDDYTTDDMHPRSFIAQTSDGDYIIGSTDGRSGRSLGFSLSDINRFLLSLGYTINFAYSLDGGGSVTLVEKGDRVNSYISNENRKVKSVIYFKKPEAYYTNMLKNRTANIDNDFRARNSSYEYRIGHIYAYSDATTKELSLRSLATLAEQAYVRWQQDRVFFGFKNDFSSDNTTYNLLDVAKGYFDYVGVRRYLPKITNSTVDYTNEIPNLAVTGIYNIHITSSDNAESLGLTARDYGQSILFNFRTNATFQILFTRANVWWKYTDGNWVNINGYRTITPTKGSGITGDLYAIQSGNVVNVSVDITNSSAQAASTQIATGLPNAVRVQNGLFFSDSTTCRVEVSTSGVLTTLDAMPSGSYKASFTYISL